MQNADVAGSVILLLLIIIITFLYRLLHSLLHALHHVPDIVWTVRRIGCSASNLPIAFLWLDYVLCKRTFKQRKEVKNKRRKLRK